MTTTVPKLLIKSICFPWAQVVVAASTSKSEIVVYIFAQEDTEESLPILRPSGSVRANSAPKWGLFGVQKRWCRVGVFPEDSVSAQKWQLGVFCALFLTLWEPFRSVRGRGTVKCQNQPQIYTTCIMAMIDDWPCINGLFSMVVHLCQLSLSWWVNYKVVNN